jgi:multicomponent Na+:H+ antiporter subunit A
MLGTIVICLMTALLCFFLKSREKLGWCLSIIPFCLMLFFLSYTFNIDHGATPYPKQEAYDWIPFLHIQLSFYLDGLSNLFAVLVTGIGTLVVIYSSCYLKENIRLAYFYGCLFFFMGAMLGLVLADDLITLFIFWELTSIASFLLISFDNARLESRKAAIQGLLVTVGGGLALLIGFVLIMSVSHQTSISELLSQSGQLQQNAWYFVIVSLILIGCFTKSAQFPFHFWLPNAMQAPTPVSAYLHSATMVQAGIYLIARLTPVLGHTPFWFFLLTFFGAITMILSVILALSSRDIKEILAYSTTMSLGMLMFLLASGQPLTTSAAILFFFVHALYKSGLFLCVGNMTHVTGMRDIEQLQGLKSAMPLTFLAVLLLTASMAGLPPLLGFISKESIYEAHLTKEGIGFLLILILMIANIAAALIAGLLAFKPFLGHKAVIPSGVEGSQFGCKDSLMLSIPALILGVLSLCFGLLPYSLDSKLITPAISAVTQLTNAPVTGIHVWSGMTPAFILSLITLSLAIICYVYHRKIISILRSWSIVKKYSSDFLFERGLVSILKFSIWLTKHIQSGRLSSYLLFILITVNVLLFGTLIFISGTSFGAILPVHAHWFDYLLVLLVLIPAVSVLKKMHYIATIACLGVVGLGTTLIYIIYSAPDVAITQILVDILTTVIVALALYRLPQFPVMSELSRKMILRNAMIALMTGLLVTILLLSVTSIPFDRFISIYYEGQTLANAHGRNVVNVILVDFRAFDTMGEILVVSLAGLGIFGLLSTKFKKL